MSKSPKTFKAAAKPAKAPTAAEIAAFEAGPADAPAPVARRKLAEATTRLSVDLPADLHLRFRLACLRERANMTHELHEMVQRRTEELERKHK